MATRFSSNFRRSQRLHGDRSATFIVCTICFAFLAAALGAQGDEIYLKNGRKISGAVVREDSDQVAYESGGGEFSLPKSLVDHIDRTISSGSKSLSDDRENAPRKEELTLPPHLVDASRDSSLSVVRNNAVDPSRLASLDNQVLESPTDENRFRLALGYRQAGEFLTQAGKPDEAIELYHHALNFAPSDLNLTVALGYLLVLEKNYSQAVDLLLPAANQFPKSADIPLLLGSAYYYTENLDRAIVEWKQSLALRQDPRVRDALARAERESSVAGSYREMRSLHFLLRYQGGDAKPLAEQVLRTLDADFKDLQLDLDVYPRETIVVLLYPDQTFSDITRLPSWAGAVNDGKIRIPVSGLTSMTSDLARVLRHELTHSFVHQATLGRCPVWFNEGLAQLEEGSTTVSSGARLARALASRQTAPFSDLETSFLELPKDKVGTVYAKSLAALEFLRDTYGMPEIRRLLRLMATHPDFDALLQSELRLTYPILEQNVAAYIEKRYGS